MFTDISHSSIFVTDQDEALDFYVGKLGLEVTADVQMETMRWLTVHVPGDPGHNVLLETPTNPFIDKEGAAQIRDLLSKGALGLGFILKTDDCVATCRELEAKGVELTDQPTDRFYGIDAGVRDPFGNHLRITQEKEWDPSQVPGA